jgi:hypothetical protein
MLLHQANPKEVHLEAECLVEWAECLVEWAECLVEWAEWIWINFSVFLLFSF